MGTTHVNQRQARRVAIRLNIRYETDQDFLDDYAANLSAGGMFIVSKTPFDIGTRFRLRFDIPGLERRVSTYATVKWVVPPGPQLTAGMGVSFDPLRPSERRALENLITRTTPT